MSKTIELENSSLPGQFSVNLNDNYGILWLDRKTGDFYRTLLTAMAFTVKNYRSKKDPRIGMSIKDSKGNFKFGCILSYHKPEDSDEEDGGNWFLELTFDEKDMTDLDRDLDNHSDAFITCSAKAVNTVFSGRFRSTEIMYNMFNCAIDTLVAFLDANASETEELELVLPGVFTASVAVENGEKVMSIVPGEYIKQLIKDDSAL